MTVVAWDVISDVLPHLYGENVHQMPLVLSVISVMAVGIAMHTVFLVQCVVAGWTGYSCCRQKY